MLKDILVKENHFLSKFLNLKIFKILGTKLTKWKLFMGLMLKGKNYTQLDSTYIKNIFLEKILKNLVCFKLLIKLMICFVTS